MQKVSKAQFTFETFEDSICEEIRENDTWFMIVDKIYRERLNFSYLHCCDTKGPSKVLLLNSVLFGPLSL